jgi:exopolysaccharide production protein ExoQ
MEMVERMNRPNFLSLTNTWVLCAILLVFASLYGFSFERGSLNSVTGVDTQAVEASDTGRDTLIKAQASMMYLLSMACILPSIKPVWRQVQRNALIFSVLGWAIVSVLWSDMPSTSAFNSLRMAINLALVIYLFERYSANDIQKLIMLVGCVAAAGSIFLVFVLPQYGLQSRGGQALGAWEGIFGQKNLCGLEMLILLLPAFFVKLAGPYARMLRGSYIATVMVIIAMTHSAGAWVVGSLCIAFVVFLKFTVRMPSKDAAVLVIVLAGAGALVGVAAYSNYDTLMYALGKDPTMTGRTELWAGLTHLAMKRPVIGYGYTAFWQGITKGPTRSLALQMGWLGLAGAENGVLEMWLELGIVGVLLYVVIFLRAVRDGLYCIGRGASPAVLWYVSILFYVVATNIEGGLLLAPSDLACILPFVAFIGLRREARRMREMRAA